jgi:MinD-like ATPase involved in chromosome partitioning or flagellar assembly
LFQEIREGGDSGVPVVISNPSGPAAEAFMAIAAQIQAQLVHLD